MKTTIIILVIYQILVVFYCNLSYEVYRSMLNRKGKSMLRDGNLLHAFLIAETMPVLFFIYSLKVGRNPKKYSKF